MIIPSLLQWTRGLDKSVQEQRGAQSEHFEGTQPGVGDVGTRLSSQDNDSSLRHVPRNSAKYTRYHSL